MKERILVVVPSLAAGGQEKQALLAASQLRQVYDVVLVVFDAARGQYASDLPIHEIHVPASANAVGKVFGQLRRARGLRRLRREMRPLAVYSFNSTANLANVLSGGVGCTIVSVRSYSVTQPSMVRSLIYRRADKIVCNARQMEAALLAAHPAARGKTVLIPNGCALESIQALATETAIDPPASPAVCAMGRLDQNKGFSHLLRAFAQVIRKQPAATLTLLGDGPLLDTLRQQAQSLGIADRVYFRGYQANPFALLSRCDVFVLSSYLEGLPNALLEALALGVAAVSTDCRTGPREILSNDGAAEPVTAVTQAPYGVLVPPFETREAPEAAKEAALADAICLLLADGALRRRYQQAGPARAAFFSVDAYRENLLALFSACHGRKGGTG